MEVFSTPNVTKFIQDLPKSLADRLQRTITHLERYGNMVRFPHSKPVGHGLFELRTIGAVHVRILYFYDHDKAILAHAFTKKRQDVSPKDIEYALEVKKKYLAEV